MSVRIQLDDPHAFYTNLDYISGRIILHLTSDENVSAILVKLEGESRTVLMRPMEPRGPQQLSYARQNQRGVGGIATENHKILYKVDQVFPSRNAQQGLGMGTYTLRPGQHEYPFRFKIPFNNGCSEAHLQQLGQGSGFASFGLGGMQQLQYKHVKKTLPPSLTGFPGEAEIRYYIKVTVQRPSLFKENRRSAIGFKFLPIEPPRPAKTANEVYARRPYAFQAGLPSYAKKSSMFKKKPAQLSDTAPKGEIDARLPSPAILTCNEPLPLRLIARNLNKSAENVFLMSLQVQLFGSTEVRAQDLARIETTSWVLMSLTGLAIQLGSNSDEIRTETVIDQKLWDRIPLPNTVAPSFDTCNLSRKYELEVKVGLGYGVPGEIQPQIITLPLRFQVNIFSGIHPPAALLDAMASRPAVPVRPAAAVPNPQTFDPAYPPQVGTPGAPAADDAPPSYEDAMADELSPADGPRREYSGVTDVNAPSLDEKGGSAPKYSEHGPPGGAGGSHSAIV